MTINIKQGDALDLSFIPDESIDLVVTSPPYFAVRVYKDGGKVMDVIGNEPTPAEYVAALSKWMAEMWRVLKPSGNVFVVLGDKMAGSGGHNNSAIGASKERGPGRYNQASNGIRKKSLMGLPWRFAIACIDAGWILRAEIVWAKPNGMPESVTDRVRRSHETIFHFVKSEKHYAAIDRLRVPHNEESIKRSERGGGGDFGMSEGIANAHTLAPDQFVHPLGAAPGSVWTISTSGLTIPKETIEMLGADKHYAAYPPEIPRRAIEGWCPRGICTVCGEGRRPLVKRTPMQWTPSESREEAVKTTNRTRLSGHMDVLPSTRLVERPQAKRAIELAKEKGLTQDHLDAIQAVGITDADFGQANNTGFGKNTEETKRLAAEAKVALGSYFREFVGGTPQVVGETCRCNVAAVDPTTAPLPPTILATVLDPFGGAGTTALVSKVLGRSCISIDISHGYTRVSLWRVFASDHAQKLEAKWRKAGLLV